MARFANILGTVGNTPVVKVGKLAPAGVDLYVKIEAFNPLGSVKDRLALGIIEDAERRLAADSAARAAAEQQRMEVERALGALERLGRLVIAHRGVLDAHHGELVERRRQQSEEVRALTGRLDELRAERAGAERARLARSCGPPPTPRRCSDPPRSPDCRFRGPLGHPTRRTARSAAYRRPSSDCSADT